MQNFFKGVGKLLSDNGVKAATCTIVLALLVLFGLPKEMQEKTLAVVIGVFLLGAAVVHAMGKKEAAELEGTVPEGRKSTASSVNLIVSSQGGPPELPKEVQEYLARPVSTTQELQEYLARSVPATQESMDHPIGEGHQMPPTPGSTVTGPVMRATTLMLALFIGLVSLVGCGAPATSVSFQHGAHEMGQMIASETREYASSDAQSGESKRLSNLHAAQQLDVATKETKKISLPQVEAAWETCEPVYRDYVTLDAHLDEEQRAWMNDVADTFDMLIEQERAYAARRAVKLRGGN